MAIFRKKLVVDIDQVKVIDKAFKNAKSEEECFGEDETITNTVNFGNGIEMDIKCCGVQYEEGGYNSAWGEAVLFKDGNQIAFTEPADEYFCTWDFEYNGDKYIVDVEREEVREEEVA